MSIKTTLKTLTAVIALGGVAFSASAANFKIAVGDGPGGTQEYGAKIFSAELSKSTNYTTSIFTSGQLGSEQETVNDAAAGVIDFSVLAANNLAPFSPKMGVMAMPYIFTSLDDVITVTQGSIGAELSEQAIKDAGVRVIAWTYAGFRVLTNSKKPVKNVSDLKGLVIRVPKNKVMIATYKAWGVNPTPMAWNETFSALQQGVVDAQDTPYITIYSMKFYEIQKYVTELKYLFLVEPIIMSEAVFQGLSKADQDAVIEAGKVATQASVQYLKDNEGKIKDAMKQAGLQIDQPANNEKEFIDLAMEKVWPAFYDKVGGKAFVNEILQATGRPPVQ